MTRKALGENQQGCLRALEESGDYPGRWMWDNNSSTVRILDSLVRRGLAEAYTVPSSWPGETRTRYRITDHGRTVLNAMIGSKTGSGKGFNA